MTIEQAENFYKQDTKDYEIEKNKTFLNWLKSAIENGYHCFIEIEELQELIDNITNWYEMKYPERELEYFEGTTYMNFQDIKRISCVMNMRQLLYRLPHNQLCLIECGYRAKNWGQHPIYENGKEVGWKTQIFMQINRKNKEECNPLWGKTPFFLLEANHMTGEVLKDNEIEQYLDSEEEINLDELLSIFTQKYDAELEFTELKESVYDHNCDMELRNSILQLVALKLLYSKNTIPERGYERAKRFIKEFNKKLELNLTTEQIDEIMHRNYTTDKELANPNIEDVVQKEEPKEEIKGIKRLVKKC
jgi:hypothetical protein